MRILHILSCNIMGIPFNADNIGKTLLLKNLVIRHRRLAEKMNESNADVLMLQEILTQPQLRIFKKHLFKYPFLVYEPFIVGPKGGVAIFSKTPIQKHTYTAFSKKGSFFNKSFIWKFLKNGILVAECSEFPLVLINTHTTANFDWDWSKTNRFMPVIESQLKQISQLIDMYKKNYSIILCGDFNIDKPSYIYKEFIQHTKLEDAFREKNIPTMHSAFAFHRNQPPIIDYIFSFSHNNAIRVKKTTMIFREKWKEGSEEFYLSDHLGLLAEFEISL